jgi:hypothetical protein
MIFKRLETIRAARSQHYLDAFSGGTLLVYDGTMPATGGGEITDQVLLAEIDLPTPSGSVSNGDFVLEPALEDILVNADGIATWVRVLDSLGEWVCDFDAGATESGAALIVIPQQLYAGGTFRLNSFTITG